MKFLWIALLVLLPVAAAAAPSERSYLAARDAYIRKIAAADKAKMNAERFSKLQDQAVADLEKQLKEVVGPSALKVPGIAATPKINNDTLLRGDQGFGMLDGLVYASEAYNPRVVVTTEGLFKAWLREHRKWWKDNELPQDPAKALTHEAFYTQAINSDAALSIYTELPIRKPQAASVAHAMLGTFAQDDGPWEPDQLVIAVLQGGKLYVVSVPAGTKLGPFPPCQAGWDQAERKSNEAFQRKATDPDGSKIRENGAAAFRRCFAEHAPKDKGFVELVRQAQAVIDALPAR